MGKGQIMSNAKLLAITVERFKSFEARTRVELAPLTIILGRNNSGKSSLIQSLLLLKQTIEDPGPEVRLNTNGRFLDALSLREITFGWPAAVESKTVKGPSIAIEWECETAVRERTRDRCEQSLVDRPEVRTLRTRMTIDTEEIDNITDFSTLKLESMENGTTLMIANEDGRVSCRLDGLLVEGLRVDFDHFFPYIWSDIEKRRSEKRLRACSAAFDTLFSLPLQELQILLSNMLFLGSGRETPPALYRARTTPNDVGVSGELAAHLLHRRARDIVHYLPLPNVSSEPPVIPDTVHARPFIVAVNDVMKALSIDVEVHVDDLADFGFRVMFGNASIVHVGRGLAYLLPLVEIGLFADPARFAGAEGDLPLSGYRALGAFTHIALEEPEAHLHPKAASRLAHWLVSLALSNRRIIVETHSDHLVRRLRGLAARAGRESELEKWIIDNVIILSVEQVNGRSTVTSSRLTAEGGVEEVWPADFMDEASDEESAIYYAKLDKRVDEPSVDSVQWDDGAEPELDDEP